MHWSIPLPRRVLLLLTLAVQPVLFLLGGATQAQPPNAPGETVWRCGQCNAFLGKGTQPALDKCPNCKSSFVGDRKVSMIPSFFPALPAPPSAAKTTSLNANTAPFLIAGTVFGVLSTGIMLGVVVARLVRR